MKIVLISDHETQGGAAQAASRLAEGLCRAHEVVRLVRFPDGQPHPWRTIELGTESAAARWLYRMPRKLAPRRFPRPNTPGFVAWQLRQLLRRLRPDVVNLHNLHGALPWGWGAELARVAAEFAPVVWTLHDMWSFTGRCAYAYDCDRFRTGCDAQCPTPQEPPRLDPAHIAPAWQERRRLLAELPGLVAVTPSRWLAREAGRGLWAGHVTEVIPYGLPTEVFKPHDRLAARQALGIEARGPVLLLAAHDLSERRKGAEIMPRLWRYLAGREAGQECPAWVAMGYGVAGPAVHSLGWIGDDATKALAYSAADLILHPAPVDNFPNVLLEALACGTPGVGLPIGGVPELLRPGVSGWLAESATPAALAEAVARALHELRQGRDLRTSCRALAETEFPLALQAERYIRLFTRLRNAAPSATIREDSLMKVR